MTIEERTAVFQRRLEWLGVACDPRTAERLEVYQRLLEDWNQRMNLTGDASLEATLDRHFMDSLAPLALPDLFPEGTRLADVGTGAGFPGLPLAIARPDLEVLLMDSLQKRLTFLDAVVTELGLSNVRTAHVRAEDAGQSPAYRGQFDVTVARAVASVPVLLELLLPLTRVGGQALCYKGPAALEEMTAGMRAAQILGGGAIRTLALTLPMQPDWQHTVLAVPKTNQTPAQYPRKAGLPAKAPLGTV